MEVRSVQLELAKRRAATQVSSASVRSLAEELKERDARISKLIEQVEGLACEKRVSENQLVNARRTIEQMQLDVARLNTTVTDLRADNASLKLEMETMRTWRHQLASEAESRQHESDAKVIKLQAQFSNLRKMKDAQSLKIKTVQKQIHEAHTRKNTELQRQLEHTLQGHRAEKLETEAELQRQIAASTEALHQREAIVQSLRDGMRNLKRQVSEQNLALKVFQARNAELAEELSEDMAIKITADMLVRDLPSTEPEERIKSQKNLLRVLHPDKCPAERIATMLTQEVQRSAAWMNDLGG